MGAASNLILVVLAAFAVLGLARLVPVVGRLELSDTMAFPAVGRLGTWPRPKVKLRWPSRAELLARLGPVFETGGIVLFAMWVGAAYLDFDPTRWPLGGDFALNVQGYAGWAAFKQCGLCVLWNGTLNGGAPLFADLLGAIAHPLVVAFVLLWGPVVAMKVTVVAGLALAGLAQWWLARLLGLGWVARLWSAAMAIVGGHLAGRMEGGLVEVLFSAASCSLVLPAILNVAQTASRRATVLLGGALALALVSGQGYMQLGVVFAILPAAVLLVVTPNLQLRPVWRAFVWSGLIALLLTAYYWVPLLHFFPNIGKPADADFGGAQPLAYLPLNLVISDPAYLGGQILGKLPFPAFYANYIGWVPILLAMAALRLIPGSRRRTMWFLLAAVGLVYLAASAITFRALEFVHIGALTNLAGGVRAPSEISSLAVPPLLALAAWALDSLLKMSWPRLSLSLGSGPKLSMSLAWLLLGVPLALAVRSAYVFGQTWLQTDFVPADIQPVVSQLAPRVTGWIEPPYGDFGFVDMAVFSGLKITNTYRPWTWRDVTPPPALVKLSRDAVDPSTPGYRGQVGFAYVVDQPQNSYAFVQAGSTRIPCAATAVGGNIDVQCQSSVPGQLIVNENSWSGWGVTRDGFSTGLGSGPTLSTAAPAGTHTYQFRYRPWDVALGAVLALAGLALAIWLWRASTAPNLGPPAQAQP